MAAQRHFRQLSLVKPLEFLLNFSPSCKLACSKLLQPNYSEKLCAAVRNSLPSTAFVDEALLLNLNRPSGKVVQMRRT